MSALVAFHAPRTCPVPRSVVRSAGPVELTLPDLSPRDLAEIAKAVTEASEGLRERRPIREIVPPLAAAAARCATALRSNAVIKEALAATTKLSLPMIERGVPPVFEALTAEALRGIVDVEVAKPDAIDGFRRAPCPRMTARGPTPAVHFAAGNVPGLAVPPLAFSLLARGAAIVKPSLREPLLAACYAQSLAEIDPELADCCAVLPWEGTAHELNRTACELAEVVTVSGSEATVRAVKAASSCRVLAFGPRMSIAIVGPDISLTQAACAVAVDVALYDQRGCLSPSAVYVEGTAERGRDFAAALARSLGTVAAELPPGDLSLEEAAAVRRFRDQARWKKLGGHEVGLWFAPVLAEGSVTWEPELDCCPTPGCRCVRVYTVATPAKIETLRSMATGRIEAIGAEGARTRESIGRLAGALRASRVCPLGQMQSPALHWPQGGRPRLGDLLHWTAMEEGRLDA